MKYSPTFFTFIMVPILSFAAPIAFAIDSDADGVDDADDNCMLVANADQLDTNSDGFGNACDADLNNDCVVNALDISLFRDAYLGTPGLVNWNEDADFDGSNAVNFIDYSVLRNSYLEAPGPASEECQTAVVLPTAFLWFSANVTVALDGDEIVLEATGRPNHTSAYWNPDNASGLYVEPDPDITTVSQMSPGFIENYNNLFTLRVPVSPSLAGTSSATTLGPVGLAVSGAPIFNDQEGPNIALAMGVIQGFDRNGAHTGPQTYHYHLEPKAITDDDESLVGVIADGFLLYGRKCFSTGTYPTDLDVSGGHTSITQHTGAADGDEVYHYHIKDEFYLSAYYLLFPEDYQGTPNTISN